MTPDGGDDIVADRCAARRRWRDNVKGLRRMSIAVPITLLAAVPHRADGAAAVITGAAAAGTVALWLAWRAGAFRGGTAVGPVRFDERDTLLSFLVRLCAAVACTFFAAAVLYGLMPRHLPTRQRQMAAGMLAGVFTFFAVVATAAARPGGLRRLGLSRSGIARGLLTGAAGTAVVTPWLLCLMVSIDTLRRHFFPDTHAEHEVFALWRQSTVEPWFRALLLIAPGVVAPLAEEALCRGLLQTALGRLFSRGSLRAEGLARRAAGQAPLPVPDGRARWLAIATTSLLFALMHQPVFIQPPIFALSMALGYVYERTGNLWACIFMHALFNVCQFALFLLVVSAGG